MKQAIKLISIELISVLVFLILFSMLALDVAYQLNTADIHGAVESIVVAQQGGAQ